MNVYAIFIDGLPTIYVLAPWSDRAVEWAEKKFGHVSGWAVATKIPSTAIVFECCEECQRARKIVYETEILSVGENR